MKKLLFLFFLGIGALLYAQTDLSKYHNENDIWNKVDDNITTLTTNVATNVTSAATNATDIDALEAIKDAHGFMSFKDSSVAITVSADSTWYAITNTAGTLWTTANLAGMAEAGDSITLSVAGDYIGMLVLSLVGTASDTIEVGILKNNSLATTVTRVSTIGTETVSLTLPFYLGSLAIGDDLVPVVQQLVNTDNITVMAGSLLIRRQE